MKKIEYTFSQGKISLIAVLILVVVAGCSKPEFSGGKFSMPPMPVEVAKVKMQTVEDKYDAVGTIEASEAITVVSEIDGAVVSLPFQEGSYVSRGALIAQLDDSQLSAEVDRAEALRDQSRTNYDRIKEIVRQNAAAPQDLDDAAAALKVAEANLALAKARFSKTRITAPFDGMIGGRRVSVGTFVRSGAAITDLANIDQIRVSFSAPERYLPDLHRNAEVAVSTIAFPGYEVRGKIIAVEPVLDPGTRSARIIARMTNPGRKFRPGMSATINAILSERSGAITIPNEAVFANGNQTFVYIVKPDSTAARVPIVLGTRLADVVEITQGLSPNSEVVRAGHQKLFDGARVVPISSTPYAQK